MEIKLKKLPKSKVKFEVMEDAVVVKKYFDKTYEKLASTVEIKGFRPGKAPRMLTIETIGRTKYNSEALNLALPQIYSAAVREKKLVPVAHPKINIIQFEEDKPIKFEAEIDLLPEAQIGDYKKIKVKHKIAKVEVKKEEVEKVIRRLQHQSAKYIITGDPAKNGDKMEISFVGKLKGVMKDKYTSKHYPFILGENILLPGFEKELIGTKKGDDKKFSLKVGKDKVDFDVTIDEVWQVDLPKLDTEFLKKFGHKNLKDLKSAISKSIKMEKEQKERRILEEKVLDEVLKKVEIDLSDALVEQEINRRIERMKKQAGPAFEKYLEKLQKTPEQLRKEIRPMAERAVKISLTLSEISKDMGYFDSKKLSKDMKKNQQIQQQAIKKTLDKLIEIAMK